MNCQTSKHLIKKVFTVLATTVDNNSNVKTCTIMIMASGVKGLKKKSLKNAREEIKMF